MKLGLDVHGVIDVRPEIFSLISNMYVISGHEVHIITGSEDSPRLRATLGHYGIKYTHLYSIISYHKNNGLHVRYDDPENPWIDKDIWDRSKAEYCAKNDIDLHIDDSGIYGRYFLTPYIRYRDGLYVEKFNVSSFLA